MRHLPLSFLAASLLVPAFSGRPLAPPEVTAQGIQSVEVAEEPFTGAPEGTDQPGGTGFLAARVPFLSQTPLLCGGAAAAMVKRFWGEKGVYAEDYRDLVRPDEGGIRVTDLAGALEREGWDIHSIRGAPRVAEKLVGNGVPVIALEGVDGGRFHYVVLVEWTRDSVGFHDPAMGPGLREVKSRFLNRWRKAGYRGLVILPAEGAEKSDRETQKPLAAGTEHPRADGEEMEYRVGSDLVLARAAFDEERYSKAAALARRSLRRDPGNPAARRILAASLYLEGRHDQALFVWNRIGRPSVDLVEIHGLRTLPHPRALSRLGTEAGDLLTPSRLRLAERRLAAIPAVVRARADYTPNPDGSVALQLYAMEASPFWRSWSGIAGLGLEGLTRNQVGVQVPGLLKEGEALSVRGSWLKARTIAALDFSTPSTPLPGIVSVRGSWGLERYLPPDGTDDSPGEVPGSREEWKTLGLFVEDWVSPDLRVRAGLELGGWKERGTFWGMEIAAFSLFAEEKAGVRMGGGIWAATDETPAFSVFSAEGRWRRRPGAGWPIRAEVRAGVSLVSRGTPRNLWPGAGQGLVRPHLLRAHSLSGGSGIMTDRLSMRLWHGGAEFGFRGWQAGPFRISPGMFLDVALPHRDSGKADMGASIRLTLPAVPGWLEASVGRGLTDDVTAVSLAWRESWWH